MNYLEEWEILHRKTILEELNQAKIELIPENISRIIIETSFAVRSKKHSEKCPYYSTGSSCHPEIQELNCFLCACPNYESDKLIGGCKINSKKGKFYEHQSLPEGKIWDCSDCSINHRPSEIRNYLTENIDKLKSLSSLLFPSNIE
jgi:Zn-finger protein